MDSDNNWLPFEIIHMFMWMSSGLIHGRNIATVSHKLRIIRSRSSGALMVEVWICTNMALQNLQQYGCQTGNKLKEKSRDLNRNSSRNKNETMFGSGYENCPEFGVLGGVIFKLDIL